MNRPAAAVAAVDTSPRPAIAATHDRVFEWSAAVVLVVTFAQALALARLYPEHRLDPDLLAYCTYFRNWLADDRTIQQMPYFTAPKPLLVFTLGALGDPALAFYCSALASAALSTVLYLLWRECFGRTTAVLSAVILLLDSSKAMLALTSSADLYLALLLSLAMLSSERGRLFTAALALFGAVLVKPVALPCAACLWIGADRTPRRWLATGIPLLAVPLVLLGNWALLGKALSGAQFFSEFASMGGAAAIGPGEVVHFALWTQLIKTRFVATASFGVAGIVLWIGGDRDRFTRPVLLVPLLFLAGYLALSIVTPFPPYFRYFWPLEVWFLPFVIFAAVEGARRIAAGNRWLGYAATAAILLLLIDGLIGRAIDYRRDYALPTEHAMRVAESAGAVLRARRRATDVVMVPLGLLPFMLWEFPEAARDRLIYTAERVARDDTSVRPDWILHVPGMYTSARALERVSAMIQTGGFVEAVGDEQAGLFGSVAGHAVSRADAGGP